MFRLVWDSVFVTFDVKCLSLLQIANLRDLGLCLS